MNKKDYEEDFDKEAHFKLLKSLKAVDGNNKK